MRQIADGLFSFTGLMLGRVYATRDPDGLTLMDTGIGSAALKIVAQLRAAGHAPTDVKRILITHAHIDHIGGLPKLKELTGAQVICPLLERDVVEGRIPPAAPDRVSLPLPDRMLWQNPKPFHGTPVDRVLRDGDLLPEVFGGLQALHTPGHSPGHTSYWQPARRILILGDVLMHLPWGLRLPFAFVSPDMEANRRNLARLAALEPDLLCFGHGGPVQPAAAALKAAALHFGRED